jgi:hypothetical protein
MSHNMMLWLRGGEWPDGLAGKPQKQGTTMSLRAKVVASIAVAASAFLIAPAAAQAATHPVQVSGAKLKSALLPASAFGSGFKLIGATSSGKSLWHQKPAKHVSTMSCANFENQGLTRYGESAVATSAILNNGSTNITSLSDLNFLYDQTVYQFPSTKAATTFYSQAHAKYASCKSFGATVSGGPNGGSTTIVLKSIAKSKVGKYHAFQLIQSISDPGLPADVSLNLNTLVTVAGTDVFVVVDFTTSNHPVPAKTMLKLVNRVRALR